LDHSAHALATEKVRRPTVESLTAGTNVTSNNEIHTILHVKGF